jgi:hypothetical protein
VKASSVTIDGVKFEWWIHRRPAWCSGEGWKGFALAVQSAESPARKLLLEFRPELSTRISSQKRPRPSISEPRLADSVRAALRAGWGPSSRGKPFVYEVDQPA